MEPIFGIYWFTPASTCAFATPTFSSHRLLKARSLHVKWPSGCLSWTSGVGLYWPLQSESFDNPGLSLCIPPCTFSMLHAQRRTVDLVQTNLLAACPAAAHGCFLKSVHLICAAHGDTTPAKHNFDPHIFCETFFLPTFKKVYSFFQL